MVPTFAFFAEHGRPGHTQVFDAQFISVDEIDPVLGDRGVLDGFVRQVDQK